MERGLFNRVVLCALLTGGVLPALVAWSAPPTPKNEDAQRYFEEKVRPLLYDRCTSCHGENQQKAGLRLDSRANMLKGGKSGAVIVPNDPSKSLLLQAIRHEGSLKMPPSGKLSSFEIDVFTRWIAQGAVWEEVKKLSDADVLAQKRNFWAFRPVQHPASPKVKTPLWVKNPIDAFVLAKLEAKGLRPAPPASKTALLRRVTFDLTGLPPTPKEVKEFLSDTSPKAYETVIDRLLASPHYGERWGRHWLDVVRYADSGDARGLGSDGDISEAWRYRDWVVKAFQDDMPYSEFITNQIAGDILPAKTPGDMNIPGTIASSFLAIGNWGNGDADKEKIITDIADDQVDVISRGIMGLTLGCARCHDHKFDPLSTKDYYGMAGIFFSTHILPKLTPKGAGEVPLHIPLISHDDKEKRDKANARLMEITKQSQEIRTREVANFIKSLQPQTAKYIRAVANYESRPDTDAGLSLNDYAKRENLYPYALRQWRQYLGVTNGYRRMTVPIRSLGGAGVDGWRGSGDTPSILVNQTNSSRQILTFTLPPHSVSMHPGPNSGVLAEWESPLAGTVQVKGGVKDLDPACGDGIAWEVVKVQGDKPVTIADGEFPNGGEQRFEQGNHAQALHSISLRAGDRLQLRILPKQGHSCDTTLADFEISTLDNKQSWNLTKAILDSYQHPESESSALWKFCDMSQQEVQAPTSPALTQWREAVAQAKTRPANGDTLPLATDNLANNLHPNEAQNPFGFHSETDQTALPEETRKQLRALEEEEKTLRGIVSAPVTYANGAQEGGLPETQYAGFHDVRVHRRGSYTQLGDLVPRRFPTVLAGENQPPITKGSGRLELAQWLSDTKHPLTARVFVNRVWQHHFGEGIVRTTNNFGMLGERPSHPELLDWLASEFMRKGWSIKQLHKTILLSNTYQQSRTVSKEAKLKDSDNRLLSRVPRRRLEAEAVRDNLLFVAGKMEEGIGGRGDRELTSPRRTLYVMTVRSERSGFGPLFDAADSTGIAEKRITSTVAPQALFLLNNNFVLMQTENLVQRLMSETPSATDKARVQWLYRTLYSREATEAECTIGQKFVASMGKTGWREYAQILVCANEFLYVD